MVFFLIFEVFFYHLEIEYGNFWNTGEKKKKLLQKCVYEQEQQ